MSLEAKPGRHIDARGIYSPVGSQPVVVETPTDLISHGLHVTVDAVAETWGKKAAARYSLAMQQGHTFVTNASDLSSAVHFNAVRQHGGKPS